MRRKQRRNKANPPSFRCRRPETEMPMKCLLLCLSMITMASAIAQPAGVRFQSGEAQITLLELYTSEGCSSCPPAEAWVSKLRHSPLLWKDFAPVVFHVDYWDYLGWRDPWSAKMFSERQRTYAGQWGSQSIYTPGFVLDGREWRNWSALNDGPPSSRKSVGVLTVSSTDTNHWVASFVPTKPTSGSYTIHAALLASGLNSNVKAGENKGRRLDHDFVVLSLIQAELRRDGEVARGEFSLTRQAGDGLPQPAIVVWVTEVGRLDPTQATGGWLGARTPASN